MAKNELEVKKNTEVAIFDESAFDGIETGSEELVASQFRIPLYKIVEPLSKALIEGDAFYIEDAKVGDIISTADSTVIGTEMEFQPVKAVTLYLEKDADGKTVAKHKDRSILDKCVWRTESGKKKGTFLPNGNEIQETIYLYGVNITDAYEWGAIPFSRGRLGASQTILKQLQKLKLPNGRDAPYLSHVWNFKVHLTKSNDGKPFRTWKAVMSSPIGAREDGVLLFDMAAGPVDPITGKRDGGLLGALRDNKTVVEDHDDDTVYEENVPF